MQVGDVKIAACNLKCQLKLLKEEGGIVHHPGINFLIDVSRLEKYHRKRFAMLKN